MVDKASNGRVVAVDSALSAGSGYRPIGKLSKTEAAAQGRALPTAAA